LSDAAVYISIQTMEGDGTESSGDVAVVGAGSAPGDLRDLADGLTEADFWHADFDLLTAAAGRAGVAISAWRAVPRPAWLPGPGSSPLTEPMRRL